VGRSGAVDRVCEPRIKLVRRAAPTLLQHRPRRQLHVLLRERWSDYVLIVYESTYDRVFL
jgi:hypothetical protein